MAAALVRLQVAAVALVRRQVAVAAAPVRLRAVAVVAAVPLQVVAAAVPVVVAAADAVVETEHTNMKNIKHTLKLATLAAALAMAPLAFAQTAYPTPEAAADALVDAIARHDGDAIKAVVGPDFRKYIPASNYDPEDVTNFLEAWARAHAIVRAGNDKAYLGAGGKGWTMPVPIVKTAAGWQFDTKLAPEEMRIRRIGRNELAAIQVALAYTDAQKEYRQNDWNRDGVKEYATRALSSPGKRDGLYWASLPGEPESPLGAEFAEAKAGQPYHGYLYRILTAQGKDAPGGARSYVTKGHMTDGYALIAWPAKYDDTGVMTFIVNQDGVVYEKNLGPGTDAAARAVTAFNPDASWSKVPPAR
jgi:hypothetical protein